MPVYTTLDNLRRRIDASILASLADDVNSPPDLSASETIAVVNQAISDGASLIDSYLLGRVDLSAVAVQASLERANATLALYFLYRRRYLDDALNPLALSKGAVVMHLSEVASGRVKIADADEGSPDPLVFSTTDEVERELSREKLGAFQ